jgi:hypothetical protein
LAKMIRVKRNPKGSDFEEEQLKASYIRVQT